MTDSNKASVYLDRLKLLGFDQEPDRATLPAAKVGPKNAPSATMPNVAKVGEKPRISGRSIAASLSAKVGNKTVITSVETAGGFRSTLDDASSDRPSASALTFATVGEPSIGLDWSHLLGFDQVIRPAAMVGQKNNGPALRAKVGNKPFGRPVAALSAKVGSKESGRPA